MEGRVRALASEVRSFLEPLWPRWHRVRGDAPPCPLSRGTCHTSSQVLAAILSDAGLAARVAAGTDPERDEGFAAPGGRVGHAWVVCEGLVVDITADQFGLPPVVLVREDDPRYREGRDTAWPEAQVARRMRAEATLAQWRAGKRPAGPQAPSEPLAQGTSPPGPDP